MPARSKDEWFDENSAEPDANETRPDDDSPSESAAPADSDADQGDVDGQSDEPLADSLADSPVDDDDASNFDSEIQVDGQINFDGGDLFGLSEGEEFFVDGTIGRSDLATERDEYRDALMRVKADFDNYKKRIAKDHAATVERAATKLVTELLPVLDACDAAIAHGASDVEPIFKSLLDVLEKEGLERIQAEGEVFDPNLHDAVLHEPSDADETVVIESLRTGYRWKGRVIRPAMVKVAG